MSDYLTPAFPELLDYEAVAADTLSLTAAQLDRAAALSSEVPEARQWQTYLNALALLGFEQWMQDRAPHLTIDAAACSALQPAYANLLADTVCNLSVGEFKLCLLTSGSLMDEQVTLSRAAIDLPEFAAHFYVLVEVAEELEQVTIQGFLRHDRLTQQLQQEQAQPDADWTYSLPLTALDNQPDDLLLYLRCLEPSAIPLPAAPDRTATLSALQAQLATVLPQLQDADRPLQQVLTWEQAAVVLTSPDLVNWVYQLQTVDPAAQASPLTTQPSLSAYLSDLLQTLAQPVVNAGLWLRDELDNVAQSLSWTLLPPLATASALRSTVDELDEIAAELSRIDLAIPPHARIAYRNLDLGEVHLRLYAAVWPLSETLPEWTLLLVLGTRSGYPLPHTVTLRISDQTSLLVERTLAQNSEFTYVYASVVGEWHEKFIASIDLMDGRSLTLPAFGFNPN